jgi:hypothetical protein
MCNLYSITTTKPRSSKAAPPLQRTVRRGFKARATLPLIAAAFAAHRKIGTYAATHDVTHARFAVVSGCVFASKSETMLRAENPPRGRDSLDFVVESEKRLQLNGISVRVEKAELKKC